MDIKLLMEMEDKDNELQIAVDNLALICNYVSNNDFNEVFENALYASYEHICTKQKDLRELIDKGFELLKEERERCQERK